MIRKALERSEVRAESRLATILATLIIVPVTFVL